MCVYMKADRQQLVQDSFAVPKREVDYEVEDQYWGIKIFFFYYIGAEKKKKKSEKEEIAKEGDSKKT